MIWLIRILKKNTERSKALALNVDIRSFGEGQQKQMSFIEGVPTMKGDVDIKKEAIDLFNYSA